MYFSEQWAKCQTVAIMVDMKQQSKEESSHWF